MQLFTFRTNRFQDQLRSIDSDLFVFGSLKVDLEKFKKLVLAKRPAIVVGVAMTSGSSVVEPVALNRFGLTKTIDSAKPARLDLAVPAGCPFEVSKRPTHSFCNWTMFKVQDWLTEQELGTTFVFIHLNEKDLPKFLAWARTLEKGPNSLCIGSKLA